jgi:hypothetical protein
VSTDTDLEPSPTDEEAAKILPFLRGKFGLYWTPDGRNVHLRVLVDGFPPFEQDMPFSMVQRFLKVESPAEMMAQIDEMAQLQAGEEDEEQTQPEEEV